MNRKIKNINLQDNERKLPAVKLKKQNDMRLILELSFLVRKIKLQQSTRIHYVTQAW